MSLTKVQRSGLTFAFLGVFLFSASLPLTKLALQSFDPLFTAFARPLIALVIALPLMVKASALTLPRALWRPMIFTTLGAVFGWPILIASSIGTILLILFALSRGGASGSSTSANLFTMLAVFASSYCYVEGAGLTRHVPGWQVISWIVILGSPASLVGAVIVFAHTHHHYSFHAQALVGLLGIGFSSMYFGFFAWYRGLQDLGVTLLSACGIVLCVLWAITTANSN